MKGFGNLNMDSTNNEHSLPLQAGNSLNVSLDDSEFPLDLGDMTSFERPTMLTFESPTPDSSPSPNLVSNLKLIFHGSELFTETFTA